jgi:signal transduction histidine kinase/ActR/RegA family two-component response regulator
MNNEVEMIKEFKDCIVREQVRLAMEQVPTMQATSFIVALVLAFVVRHIVPQINIFAWLLLLLPVIGSRIVLFYRFRRVLEGPFVGEYWKNIYLSLALCSGIVWGLSAFVIFPSGNAGLISLFVLVIASLTAATTVSHSSIKFAPAAWAGPVILCYAARCVMEGGEIGYTIGFLILVYLFTMLRYSFTHHKSIASAIALKFENLQLLEEVQKINETLSQGNAERKRTEAERLELERRLLHAQKLESLGVLAGGIAHDFNNLLMAIQGNLELTLLALPKAISARPRIEQAIQTTRRAADLTRQMLAYSGKGRFVVSRMDLSDLVWDNADLFRTAIARTVTLNLSMSSQPCIIEADPGQVQQVIMNLITNAFEAIGEKPGVITLATGVMECEESYLSRSLLEEKPPAGRFVYVEVSDTGCGMDEETRQRLFDPFFTTKFTGRGLGMSAVLGIMRGHRGAILMDSAVAQGTNIRVLFPACEAISVEPAEVSDMPLSEPLTAGMVLVVDDEEAVRSLCMDLVRQLGFRAIGAGDGEEALQLFAEHADELTCVLLDLTMPRMDGLSAFREMKRLRPEVPVILCSGYSEHNATQQFAGEGLAGFIQKPYSLEELHLNLTYALQESV